MSLETEARVVPRVLYDACTRCSRTLLELRKDATRESMRGSAPLCSVPNCPLVKKVLGFADRPIAPGREITGPSPPAVFVGRFGYPKVAIGPLLPPMPELAPHMADSPTEWANKLDIAEILQLRGQLIRSKSVVRVDAAAQSATLDASRSIAMSDQPLDTEIILKKPPKLRLEARVDQFAAPMGPSVDVIDARVLADPSVPRKVDAIVSDIHADAATGSREMYDGGISAYHIQRLLSVGLLGQERRRKLVPTRWSITATDDILGKQLVEDVKECQVVDAPQVFSSDLFGNYFHVLLMPRVWAFEMIESWQGDGDSWQSGHDLEGYDGRTNYADSITGAYYAARLSVLEYLREARRQATVFVYREITEEYWAPLGVWVIREAVKHAMANKSLVFDDIESAMRHMHRATRNKEWPRVAILPKEARAQRTLRDFLGE